MDVPETFRHLGIGLCQCCKTDNVEIGDLGYTLVNRDTGETARAACRSCLQAAMHASAPGIIAKLRDHGYNAQVRLDALGLYDGIELVEQNN